MVAEQTGGFARGQPGPIGWLPLVPGTYKVRVELPATVKVFPDLSVLTRDALTLARAEDQAARRVVRVRSEGREFESLREYRPGDDRRTIDWKATAR